ncbi:hypothetical protein G6F57_013315 [Rhizopus arrhizus]|nr:hypothetical protein G6F57_013315 [Rhizopus arrhizus]
MRILLIEDDAALADGLIRALQGAGHLCDHLSRGLHAPAALASAPYDVMVLDLSLPDVDGLDLLSRLRNDGVTLPVLILTARDGIDDRILGLDRGGDDYLAKPFALGELEARLRALSRRRSDAPAQKRLGRLCFDSIRNEAQVDGQRVELTARELALVEALMQHPGRTVTKQRLFDALYSWDHEANLSVIEVHVSRLRRKLEQARAGPARPAAAAPVVAAAGVDAVQRGGFIRTRALLRWPGLRPLAAGLGDVAVRTGRGAGWTRLDRDHAGGVTHVHVGHHLRSAWRSGRCRGRTPVR